jgi:hypothetical protein
MTTMTEPRPAEGPRCPACGRPADPVRLAGVIAWWYCRNIACPVVEVRRER